MKSRSLTHGVNHTHMKKKFSNRPTTPKERRGAVSSFLVDAKVAPSLPHSHRCISRRMLALHQGRLNILHVEQNGRSKQNAKNDTPVDVVA